MRCAYLFLAGECPPFLPSEYPQDEDFLVAADGGYRHLRRLGLLPHLLLGDFDSLTLDEVREAKTLAVPQLRYEVAKDYSDADLALTELKKRGITKVRLCGALGGERFDHALANIALLSLWKRRGVDIELLHGSMRACVISQQTLRLVGRCGDIVSLLPLSEEVLAVSCQGLRYPLHRETLYGGESRSISNVLLTEEAEVTVEEGLLLVIHYRGASRER